jgi:hypothetical protein
VYITHHQRPAPRPLYLIHDTNNKTLFTTRDKNQALQSLQKELNVKFLIENQLFACHTKGDHISPQAFGVTNLKTKGLKVTVRLQDVEKAIRSGTHNVTLNSKHVTIDHFASMLGIDLNTLPGCNNICEEFLSYFPNDKLYDKPISNLLLEVYNTPEKIDEILKLGDMEMLEPTVKSSAQHSYTNKNIKGDHSNTYPSFEKMMEEKMFTEYTYLFQDNTWYTELPNNWRINKRPKFIPLTDYMKNPDKEFMDYWKTETSGIARIIKKHPNGTYSAIDILHYGQPYTSEQFLQQQPNEKTVGELLLKNYNTPEKIDEILKLGKLEKLEATAEDSDPHRQDYKDSKTDNTHTYPTLEKARVGFFYSAGFLDPECHQTDPEYYTATYTYLFQDDTWHIDDNDGKFIPLTDYVDRIQKKHQETANKETKEPSMEI